MKLKGKISMFIGVEETTIRIQDENSNIEFVEITLTPAQLSSALSRLAYTPCNIEVRGLDRVGKKHENKEFEFEISEKLSRERKTEQLREIAQSMLTDGWIAEGYFNSQNSFFTKDGVSYARCTIRRWV